MKGFIVNKGKGTYGSGNPLTIDNILVVDKAQITVSFGTTAGTIAEGNDLRIINGQTAYEWGDHSLAGYSTADTTYTAGTGISITSGAITNTAPDQTVSLTGAGSTTITGTYPNFTITSTDTNTDTQRTDEEIRDVIGTTLVGSGATTVTIDDADNRITISSTDTNTTYSAGTGITLSGTTFSASFGSIAGTVAEGNDSRIVNGQTAYGWGDHSLAGYITGIANITEIATRSYNDLQDLPTLNISSWNTAYAWGDHSVEGYVIGQNGLTGMWKGTQAEYDALTPDANTVYYIL